MKVKYVISRESLTNGKIRYLLSSGENTGDVEELII